MEVNLSIQNILDGHGVGISITGMVVVFAALALISTFIALLPAVLRIVNKIFPLGETPHALPRSSDSLENEVIAAIGLALHTEMGKHIPDK
ncbi:MAG: OadG family protein [Candidatus Scalindua sp.]|nr:OadG family protein [Candidatus Scalindua sp.]